MKESKRIIVFVISVLTVLTIFVGCKNTNNETIQNEKEAVQENNSGEITELPLEQDDVMNLIEYVPLLELLPEYSIENAIDDKCFVITKDNELYNDNVLQDFKNSISATKPTNIRVVMGTADEKLSIIDINYSGDEIKVVQDDTRLEEGIHENIYYMSQGYIISNEDVLLEDGNSVHTYQLVNTNTEEKIELFGYLIFTKSGNTEDEEINNHENEGLNETKVMESGE